MADYAKLADVLTRRGYSSDDVENVMFKNWLRVLSAGMPQNEEAKS